MTVSEKAARIRVLLKTKKQIDWELDSQRKCPSIGFNEDAAFESLDYIIEEIDELLTELENDNGSNHE